MVRVWLVRHGETRWNTERRLQGISDIELSDRGREQAEQLRLRLGGRSFDAVWSSDLLRAVETAEIIFGGPRIDARLRELDFGDLDGLTWSDLGKEGRAAMLEFDSFVAPNGESAADMRARLLSFLNNLPPGDHLAVTHGGVVRPISEMCGAPAYPGKLRSHRHQLDRPQAAVSRHSARLVLELSPWRSCVARDLEDLRTLLVAQEACRKDPAHHVSIDG